MHACCSCSLFCNSPMPMLCSAWAHQDMSLQPAEVQNACMTWEDLYKEHKLHAQGLRRPRACSLCHPADKLLLCPARGDMLQCWRSLSTLPAQWVLQHDNLHVSCAAQGATCMRSSSAAGAR